MRTQTDGFGRILHFAYTFFMNEFAALRCGRKENFLPFFGLRKHAFTPFVLTRRLLCNIKTGMHKEFKKKPYGVVHGACLRNI
jgi:hypothetical protein